MALSRPGTLYRQLRRIRNQAMLKWRRLRAVHSTSSIHPSSTVARDLQTAEYVFIGRRCLIAPGVRIGRYTMLASGVAIVGDDHAWNDPAVPMQFSGRPRQRTTDIGADVWLGHGVLLMRGLSIGDGAIVAAGSVVTHDVPAREIWAGVPAQKLRDRFNTPAENDIHRAMVDGPLAGANFAEVQRVPP